MIIRSQENNVQGGGGQRKSSPQAHVYTSSPLKVLSFGRKLVHLTHFVPKDKSEMYMSVIL